MAKLILMKRNEVAVPEEKKGKQIAVKESNIISLREFYKNNYRQPVENIEIAPVPTEPTTNSTAVPTMEQTENVTSDIPNNQPFNNVENNIIETSPIPSTQNTILETPNNVIEPVEMQSSPIMDNPVSENIENETTPIEPIPAIDLGPTSTASPIPEEESSSDETPIINLVPEIEEELEEEMDPELKEIKERLDKVITDLNNYKKKIKILEIEVNKNLEKSRETLKDAQAAAKIMSIQQERQRQISEEMNGGGNLETDAARVLQKGAA